MTGTSNFYPRAYAKLIPTFVVKILPGPRGTAIAVKSPGLGAFSC